MRLDNAKNSEPRRPSLEEWHDLNQRLRDLQTEILGLCEEKKGSPEYYMNKAADLAEKIRAEIPRYAEYLGFAILAGGSTEPDRQLFLDLPEPYSVEKFFTALVEELKSA